MRWTWTPFLPLVVTCVECSAPKPTPQAVVLGSPPVPSASSSAETLPPATPKILSRNGKTCLLRSDHTVACWGALLSPWTQGATLIDNLKAIDIGFSGEAVLVKDIAGRVLLSEKKALPSDPMRFSPRPELLSSLAESCLSNTCCVVEHGQVLCSGSNEWNRLGSNGPSRESRLPVDGVSQALAVAVGTTHVCAIVDRGQVYCWGSNQDGQLGSGSKERGKSPPQQVKGLRDVVQIAAGAGASCARTKDGAVYCWGSNTHGLLGRNSPSESAVPILVEGIPPAATLALELRHACLVGNDGKVWCWGDNDNGQLGDGKFARSKTPVEVVGLQSAIGVTVDYYHSCALLRNETAQCWGKRDRGRLGDGQSSEEWKPVAVPTVSNATHLCTRTRLQTCAISADHSATCWGPARPPQVVRSGDALSCTESCFLLTNGAVECDGPLKGVAQLTSVSTTAEGGCGLRKDGSVLCWSKEPPGPPSVQFQDALLVRANARRNCAIKRNGELWCWGDVARKSAAFKKPVKVNLAEGVSTLSLDSDSEYEGGCVVRRDGSVGCWYWDLAVFRDGLLDLRLKPLVGVADAVSVAGSREAGCAVQTDGQLLCWGENYKGELGDGSGKARKEAVLLQGISQVSSVVIGHDYRCALRRDGTVWCWGNNEEGQLGKPFKRFQSTPVPVVGLSEVSEKR